MESIIVFILFCAIAVVGLMTYAAVKTKNWKEILKENKAPRDWKGFFIYIVLFLIVITFLSSGKAEAIEPPTFINYTELSVGADYLIDSDRAGICKLDQISEDIAVNGKLTQNLFTWYNVDFNFGFQHHSCVLNGDDHTYDGFGISVSKRWEW